MEKTAAEMKKWYEENKSRIAKFETANNAWTQLRDVTKTKHKTVSTFSKETLRTYLKNLGSNETNIRNLSRYLYYRSQVYYRLVRYFANMLCLDCRSVIPKKSVSDKKMNDKAMLQSYSDTLDVLEIMNLVMEMTKIYTVCLVEDVFYGIVFYDETGMFIYRVDPDYCKISGQYMTGDFSYSIDMSLFKRNEEVVEYLGEPIRSMYNAYGGVSANRWQQVPDEYAICIKARSEDYELILPVFLGLFNSLISLCDLEDIQAIADEQQIYKLIWMELETITGSKDVDDFKVDPALANRYFQKMVDEAVDDYTAAALVPGKLNTISFDNDEATDTNKVQKSTETVLNTSGGAQILNSATISGTTAFNAALKADAQFAISLFLHQTQAWVNRFISYQVKNPCKVKFHEVSIYTKDDYKKNLLEGGQYGLPTKLAYNVFNGFSEKDTLALARLENDILGLQDMFSYPLISSHTTSSKDIGRPKQDVRTDDGEANDDKRDRTNG